MEFRQVVLPVGEPVLLDGIPVVLCDLASRPGPDGPELCINLLVSSHCEITTAPVDADVNREWQARIAEACKVYAGRFRTVSQPVRPSPRFSLSGWIRSWPVFEGQPR